MTISAVSGCARESSTEVEALAERTAKSLGCSNFKDEFFDGLYSALEGGAWPAHADFSAAIRKRLAGARNLSISAGAQTALADRLSSVYEILSVEALAGVSPYDRTAALEILTALELGDRTTDEKARIQERLAERFEQIERDSGGRNSACAPDRAAPLVSMAAARDLAFLG
ncbi:MAG TPA: hypothetical protein VFV50_05570, partial [Bdellovibrionales bacterium]|nr:hypothetical protein [Bdellovibrionales bacterium]